jgi:predicted Rossmann fold nucleotide-binding protein DprA/Smf involved in DNA uptake
VLRESIKDSKDHRGNLPGVRGKMARRREADLKKRVLDSLSKEDRSVKEIAKKASTSTPTASKYLLILEAEGRAMRNEERPPYVLWRSKR